MDFKKKINGLVSDLDESTQYESVDFIEDLDNKELDEIWVLWEVYLRKIRYLWINSQNINSSIIYDFINII